MMYCYAIFVENPKFNKMQNFHITHDVRVVLTNTYH